MNDDDKNKAKYTFEELSKKYLEKQPEKENYKMKEIANDYQMIVSFILTILILTFLGVFFGYKLDQKIHTTPLFVLLFPFLGIAAAYRNLFKDSSRKK